MRTAREVNDAKPGVVLGAIRKAASAFGSPVVACLGLAFKPDIDDLRHSPALDIATALADAALGELLVVEPHIEALPATLAGRQGVRLVSVEEAIAKADVVALLVNHRAFAGIEPQQLARKTVVNACGWRQ